MQYLCIPLNNTSFKHGLLTHARKYFTLLKNDNAKFFSHAHFLGEESKRKLQRGIQLDRVEFFPKV